MVDEVIYKLNVGDDNKNYFNNSLHNKIDIQGVFLAGGLLNFQ